MSISTVIVAPSVLLREGIASLLQDTRYKVVASAARPAELSAACCPKGQPILIIFGIDLQNGNLDHDAASVRMLRSVMPDAKVVLVAEADKTIDLQRGLMPSVNGCIFSLRSRDALIKVLELTFLDQRVFVFADFADPLSGSQFDESSRLGINGHGLSPRESQVLACLAQGNSNKVIARLHNLSEATVKVHLKAILRKIKVHNRTQAAIWGIQHGCSDSLNNGVESFTLAEAPGLSPISQTATIQSTPSQQNQADLAPLARHSSAGNGKTR